MDWASLWLDIGDGLLIAGALAAWVSRHFLAGILFTRTPILAKFWGLLLDPS
jgi:uncharacterized protein